MKPANITVKTVNYIDGEQTDFYTEAVGTYFKKDGTVIVQYTDTLYGDREEKIQTSVKICGNSVTLTRRSLPETRLVLEQNVRHACQYATPYGTLLMGFTAEKICHSFHEKGGELFLRYAVDTENNPFQINEITLKVKDVQP